MIFINREYFETGNLIIYNNCTKMYLFYDKVKSEQIKEIHTKAIYNEDSLNLNK